MKQITIEELRRVQLQILDVVVDFCDNNGINYWIDSGTLLGAVRHKGYIPWDDDIDIGMLRPDFDRFIHEFNQNNDRYKAYSAENKIEYPFPILKVMDMNTIMYIPDKSGVKMAINIDVFCYDNAPNDETELKRMYDKRDRYRKYHTYIWSSHFNNKKQVKISLESMALKLIKNFLKLIPADTFIKKFSHNAKIYNSIDTGYVGNFYGFTRIICKKSVFNNFIYMEFEGKKYKAPEGYDEWLRAFYNDYMQLPPLEKRVNSHRFEAYINE